MFTPKYIRQAVEPNAFELYAEGTAVQGRTRGFEKRHKILYANFRPKLYAKIIKIFIKRQMRGPTPELLDPPFL